MDFGITYSNGYGITYADWAADEETRRSVGAYIYVLYGRAISWCSKRQTIIALSSCEAEYMAQTQASKEVASVSQTCQASISPFGLAPAR